MTSEFASQREKMVDGQLRTTGITNFAILEAMSRVPREEFMPAQLQPFAYADEDLPVFTREDGTRRYLMKPAILARLIQTAEIGSNDLVLEIGCATGYSTAVISCLAGSVIGLESEAALAEAASANLSRLGHVTASVVEGPLDGGHPDQAPYDVILFNGAVEEVPTHLFGQLRDGGRLIAVVGTGNAGVATIWTAAGANLSSYRAFNAAVQMLPGFVRERTFTF